MCETSQRDRPSIDNVKKLTPPLAMSMQRWSSEPKVAPARMEAANAYFHKDRCNQFVAYSVFLVLVLLAAYGACSGEPPNKRD
jgi:uncharacterized MAPEG superfamily protein